MENDKYILVIELLPGDFMPVSPNILIHDDKINFNMIENIDRFTYNLDEEEIFDLIKKENIVPENYLNGKLKIINKRKYRFPILTKNNKYYFSDFVKDYIDNKQIMNKLVNIFNKYKKEDVIILKRFIDDKDYKSINNLFMACPYIIQRNIYFYIYDNIIK